MSRSSAPWPTTAKHTTPWQFPTRELSPLVALVREAVRALLYPGEPTRTPFHPLPEGRGMRAALPDGTPVAFALESAPSSERRHGERACAGVRVTGTMAAGGRGYWIEAELLVDLATQAVSHCDVELHETGEIFDKL
ncbi:hypothetical protein [Methylobacterium aerolatum]|uniref:Uncharacterized protein n=1 Tax=Methylobacterium aerolatum TaxID=418708 RepID=A0ABU0HX73_9HYPH|nr:hypothetical protein [Methylobacterium aerolatum]MDQ0446947.1 hypothetical protein [Methylobacterium aerolatum]